MIYRLLGFTYRYMLQNVICSVKKWTVLPLFKSVYSKKQTDLTLLDFSKAFDKVSHEKLAIKLQDYGIRGPALKWVKGVLNNRHQFVIVNGFSSEPIPVSSRVPQRYVLRPLLFLIYINDLPMNVKSEVRLFADSTALQLTISTSSQSEILQKDLDNLER